MVVERAKNIPGDKKFNYLMFPILWKCIVLNLTHHQENEEEERNKL